MNDSMVKNVTIVGVGALGSHTALLLRNAKIKLSIIDFDRVEQKNVLSQFHAKSGVGKNKTVALSQLLQFLFALKINSYPHKLTSDNVEQLLNKSDLIIDCLDNAESRTLVQNFAKDNNIPCLHGALAANGDFGRVVWSNNFTIDSEAGLGGATCEDGEHLPFIGVTASYISYVAKKFLDKGVQESYSITHGGVVKN